MVSPIQVSGHPVGFVPPSSGREVGLSRRGSPLLRISLRILDGASKQLDIIRKKGNSTGEGLVCVSPRCRSCHPRSLGETTATAQTGPGAARQLLHQKWLSSDHSTISSHPERPRKKPLWSDASSMAILRPLLQRNPCSGSRRGRQWRACLASVESVSRFPPATRHCRRGSRVPVLQAVPLPLQRSNGHVVIETEIAQYGADDTDMPAQARPSDQSLRANTASAAMTVYAVHPGRAPPQMRPLSEHMPVEGRRAESMSRPRRARTRKKAQQVRNDFYLRQRFLCKRHDSRSASSADAP